MPNGFGGRGVARYIKQDIDVEESSGDVQETFASLIEGPASLDFVMEATVETVAVGGDEVEDVVDAVAVPQDTDSKTSSAAGGDAISTISQEDSKESAGANST